MIRATAFAAGLGASVAALALWALPDPRPLVRAVAVLAPEVAPQSTPGNVDSWPICTTLDFNEGPAWAQLDPDFAAGKRALAAGDLNGAIAVLAPLALRDDRNADIQNYLGYAYRRLRQLGEAMRHYQQALTLNPRHRSAHEHLGEAYLVQGDPAKAKEHLAALEQICLIPCEEYSDLKRAIAEYSKNREAP